MNGGVPDPKKPDPMSQSKVGEQGVVPNPAQHPYYQQYPQQYQQFYGQQFAQAQQFQQYGYAAQAQQQQQYYPQFQYPNAYQQQYYQQYYQQAGQAYGYPYGANPQPAQTQPTPATNAYQTQAAAARQFQAQQHSTQQIEQLKEQSASGNTAPKQPEASHDPLLDEIKRIVLAEQQMNKKSRWSSQASIPADMEEQFEKQADKKKFVYDFPKLFNEKQNKAFTEFVRKSFDKCTNAKDQQFMQSQLHTIITAIINSKQIDTTKWEDLPLPLFPREKDQAPTQQAPSSSGFTQTYTQTLLQQQAQLLQQQQQQQQKASEPPARVSGFDPLPRQSYTGFSALPPQSSSSLPIPGLPTSNSQL